MLRPKVKECVETVSVSINNATNNKQPICGCCFCLPNGCLACRVKIRSMRKEPDVQVPWNLLFIDLFIADNFHILYHNVINMSRILLISQKDKTNVDVSLFPAVIFQCPRVQSALGRTEMESGVTLVSVRVSKRDGRTCHLENNTMSGHNDQPLQINCSFSLTSQIPFVFLEHNVHIEFQL